MNGESDLYDFALQLEQLADELGGEFDVGNGKASFRGIGPRPPRPLLDYWTAVAIRAADTATPESHPEGWYDLKTEVYIKHSSPGWLDGFRITTGSGG